MHVKPDGDVDTSDSPFAKNKFRVQKRAPGETDQAAVDLQAPEPGRLTQAQVGIFLVLFCVVSACVVRPKNFSNFILVRLCYLFFPCCICYTSILLEFCGSLAFTLVRSRNCFNFAVMIQRDGSRCIWFFCSVVFLFLQILRCIFIFSVPTIDPVLFCLSRSVLCLCPLVSNNSPTDSHCPSIQCRSCCCTTTHLSLCINRGRTPTPSGWRTWDR